MRYNQPLTNDKETGAVLLGTLLVLVAVTAIGLTLSRVSSFELDMSVNEKCKEIARYNTESCALSTAKLIRLAMERVDDGNSPGIPAGSAMAQRISYPEATVSGLTDDAEFVHKIMNFEQDDVCEDCFINLPGPNNTNRSGADIRNVGTEGSRGTAANVHVGGYDYGVGLGSVSGGGATQFFLISCRGQGCNQNAAHVAYSRYRRIIGISGGM